MVVIALMNLLNALAVSDIAKMEADAEIQHQISMISILKEIEDVALSNRKVVEVFLNRFSLLRPLIKRFDFDEPIEIFPASNVKDFGITRQKSFELPSFESPYHNVSGYFKRMNKQAKFGVKVGCEDIISEARRILSKAEQSKNLNKK